MTYPRPLRGSVDVECAAFALSVRNRLPAVRLEFSKCGVCYASGHYSDHQANNFITLENENNY